MKRKIGHIINLHFTKDRGNILAEEVCREESKNSYLDSDNILWKIINDEWIGKRSVQTSDLRVVWLEQTKTPDEVKKWLCGSDNDYNETFKRKDAFSPLF
jgi:hypothetical protein